MLQANQMLLNQYNAQNNASSVTDYIENLGSLSGALDLTASALQLDPDSQSLTLSMYGQPYGLITYNQNNDLVFISVPSTTAQLANKGAVPVSSCKDLRTQQAACGDLVLTFGSTALTYATGDYMGRRTITVDVEALTGMEHYPFDEYRASGTVRVRSRA